MRLIFSYTVIRRCVSNLAECKRKRRNVLQFNALFFSGKGQEKTIVSIKMLLRWQNLSKSIPLYYLYCNIYMHIYKYTIYIYI